MQVEVDGTHRVTPLVQSPFRERNGIVSPDGRWLAYEANDSGRFEISVRPFPDVNSGHWQVSTAGGTRPLWARNGQELFYASPTGALMRVGVERASSWAATRPTLLVKEGYFTIPGGSPGRTYDISPDGQRFLMIKEGGGSDQTAAPQQRHRRAALDRGAEAPRADPVTDHHSRTPLRTRVGFSPTTPDLVAHWRLNRSQSASPATRSVSHPLAFCWQK